jgi:integrase
MLLRLVHPMKRSGSSVPHFVQRIPSDVRLRAIGRTLTIPLGSEKVSFKVTERTAAVRFSLRARDPAEAKIRQAQAAAQLETIWQGLRRDAPLFLTNRDAHALAGDLYRAWADGQREHNLAAIHDPLSRTWRIERPKELSPAETGTAFAVAARRLVEAAEREDLETVLGPIVDRLLLSRGIAEVDPECRPVLLEAFAMALRDAFESRQRNAAGDFTPDPKAARFPESTGPASSASPIAQPAGPKPAVSLKGLVEAWWQEAKATGRKPSTYESYRNTVANFVAFLGHDDASLVTPEDVIRFKDHRLASVHPRTGKSVSAKTVKDSDLAGLKAIFGWAVVNRKLPSATPTGAALNPAAGVTIKLGKKTRLRSKGFNDAEALALLKAASTIKRGAERPETFAAKRWVPWLCAYTGARVGEMAQLRKEDLRQEGQQWVVNITPEAGPVKTDEAREVVLHPHLVEQGFPEYVADAPAGHLFMRPAKDADVRGPLRGLKNRLQEFARETVTDRNVAPNHGWRHRFKTVGMEAGIDQRILDAIQGHAPASVGGRYGDVTLKTIAEAIGKLPRIETLDELVERTGR